MFNNWFRRFFKKDRIAQSNTVNSKGIEGAPGSLTNGQASSAHRRKPKKRVRSRRQRTPDRTAHSVPNYGVQNDATHIDEFVKEMHEEFGEEIINVSVGGLSSVPPKHRGRPHVAPSPDKDSERFLIKKYYVKLIFRRERCRLLPIIEAAVETKAAEKSEAMWYSEDVLKPALEAVRAYFYGKWPRYKETATCSFGFPKDKLSFHIRLSLPVGVNDIVTHCCGELVTEYVNCRKKDFVELCEKEINSDSDLGIKIYNNFEFRKEFFRKIEDKLRVQNGVPEVGKGNISQHLLYEFIQEIFPEALYEYSPDWLGRQRYDIFLPTQKIAIEYNGAQHYVPIEAWGGDEALRLNQERDRRKATLSSQNGVRILIWHHDRPINSETVSEFVEDIL